MRGCKVVRTLSTADGVCCCSWRSEVQMSRMDSLSIGFAVTAGRFWGGGLVGGWTAGGRQCCCRSVEFR
jgi:hypothetical protein